MIMLIEPTIGHIKMDGRLGRNPLKDAPGDALHAVLWGVGHNIWLLLKKLRLLFARIWQQLMAAMFAKTPEIYRRPNLQDRVVRHGLRRISA